MTGNGAPSEAVHSDPFRTDVTKIAAPVSHETSAAPCNPMLPALTCGPPIGLMRLSPASGRTKINLSLNSMARYSLLTIAAALMLCAAPVRAQFIFNGTLDTNANGWTLGGGCGDEAWDGANGNPPGSIRLNACGDQTPTRRRHRR
jgi:hypothetical protein